MFRLGDFLQGAMRDLTITVYDGDKRIFTTINKLSKQYENRFFTAYDVVNGILTIYLDD